MMKDTRVSQFCVCFQCVAQIKPLVRDDFDASSSALRSLLANAKPCTPRTSKIAFLCVSQDAFSSC